MRLKDHDHSYAVVWTDADGYAEFPSFVVESSDTVHVAATADYYLPEVSLLRFGSLASEHRIAYEHHLRDDAIQGGDGDDLLEAGESAGLRVLMEDRGSDQGDTDDLYLHLWPSAPIIFDLDLLGDATDEAYEPENIYLGELAAHPPAAGDTFRIPANWEAIRTELEPGSYGTSESGVLVWRDTQPQWHIRSVFAAADEDTVIEGILKTRGGFENVGCDCDTAGGGPDSFYASGDSLHFYFERDATADVLTFSARYGDWLAVDPESVSLGTMSAGDTASGRFTVDIDALTPDKEPLIFTAAVHDRSDWWFSDFSEQAHAAELHYLAQDTLQSNEGGSLTPHILKIYPTLSNTGTAPSDSTVLTLSTTAGSAIVQDSEVVFGPIDRRSYARAGEFFKLAAAQPSAWASVTYDITARQYFTDGSRVRLSFEDRDLVAPSRPTTLAIDEGPSGATLRWEKVTGDDVQGYHVFTFIPGDTLRANLEPVTQTTRYRVGDLDALNAQSDYMEYRFAVATVDSSGNESAWLVSDSSRVWLPEVSGWPRVIRGGSTCAPKAVDVDEDGDLEIFAAGQHMYAWRADGSPLIPENEDGLLWENDNDPDGGSYTNALAVADLDDDGNYEIIGNFQAGGDENAVGEIHVVTYFAADSSVSLAWERDVKAWGNPPIIEDLDQDGSNEVITTGRTKWIHVWRADGKSYQDTLTTHGRFVYNPDETAYCYNSLAVGDVSSTSSGVEIVQSLPSGKAVAFPGMPHTPPNSTLWSSTSVNELLSNPILGDVDDDGTLEVALTRQVDSSDEGKLLILNAATGATEQSVTSTNLAFTGDVLAAPSFLDTDGDTIPDLIAMGSDSVGSQQSKPQLLHMDVAFDLDTSIDTTSCSSVIPVPGKKWYQTRAITQPLTADLDGDGHQEILIGYDSGYLACFEWDAASSSLSEERGWPQLFGDTPLTPLIADVDADTPVLEMVVQDRSGVVHQFILPGVADSAAVSWGEYGHDERNTFNFQAPRAAGKGAPGADQVAYRSLGRMRLSPNPAEAQAIALSFSLESRGPVSLEVFNVEGRLVRRLLHREALEGGEHEVIWDGRASGGHFVSAGIYFVRLTKPEGALVRRVSVIR